MKKLSVIYVFCLGIALYFLFTYAALNFYQDDPASMNWMDREAFNARFIQRLDPDAHIKQDMLLSRLGSPDITEAFRLEQQVYQLLYYRTHRKAADGITTADECTALLFVDRRLIAIGDQAVAQYLAAKPHVDHRR